MNIDTEILESYLDGRLSDHENLEVQVWLAEHIDDPEVVSLLAGHFEGGEAVEASTPRSLEAVRIRLGMTRHAPVRLRVMAWAAAIIALFAVPAAFWAGYRMQREPLVVWQEVSVPNAETRSVTLSDGTVLVLNAGSRLTYPETFSGKERRVFLEGEVLADVAKDPERPFLIQAGDVDVRVHGTKFNFKAYRSDMMVELMLLEGSVSMDIAASEGKREVRLTPGDFAQFDRQAGDISLGTVPPDGFRSFSDNRSFSFINLPLADIAADLERSFGTRIVIADETVASRRFLAFFTNHESLDEILTLLAANGNLRVSRSGEVVYLSGKKS